MNIAVVIPVLNEQKVIGSTLSNLNAIGVNEIIVVDGGSTDRTREIASEAGARVVAAPRGRGRQMNEGARLAQGKILLFLHADTRLPRSALEDIRRALSDPAYVGGRFDVSLDGDRWIFKVVGALISLRSRLSRVATGDQAIFIRKEVFQQLGGFPDISLMEDIALSRMLKKRGKVACLRSRVITSSRRWEREGIWSTILKMWLLRLLYLAGICPRGLKQYYGEAR